MLRMVLKWIICKSISSKLFIRLGLSHLSKLCLTLLLMILSIFLLLSPSASMDVNLSIPEIVDLCEPEVYALVANSDEQADDVFAAVELPEGFSYSGGSRVSLGGRSTECEPSVQGRSLRWDLRSSLKACRNIVINEFELNPKGPDKGKEWVELYNPSSFDAKIGGWRLVDSYYKKTVTLPQDTSISPGGFIVVIWTNSTLLNSRPVSLTLYDTSGRAVDGTPGCTDEEDDDLAWARVPDGKDLDSDLDWAFQASTEGSSNGGRGHDLYPGESISLEFLLTAGCSARGGQPLHADVSSTGGSSSIKSNPLNVTRANLSVSCVPDRFEAAKGDEVSWIISIRNDGNGAARDIRVKASISQCLELQSIGSPSRILNWSYGLLGPGEEAEVELNARALSSCDHYYNLVNVSWGCGPCQVVGCKSEIGRRTAIRKLPDGPRSFTIGEDVDFQIEADLPSGSAGGLWINDSIPKGLIYSASSFYCRGASPKVEVLDTAGGESPEIQETEEAEETRICCFFGNDASSTSSSIELGYSAVVANTIENQNGLKLDGGAACMSWDGSHSDCDEAGDLSIIEPDLSLETEASSSTGDIGDEITYTISVFHSPESSSPAFDVDIQDTMPSGMTYSPGSARVISGPRAKFDPASSARLRWHFDSVDLGWNADRKVILSYNATISQAKPGDGLGNNATLTWSSLPGDSKKERDGSGGINDYLRRASSSVDIIRLSISKIDDPDPVSVGEPLTYTLTYENEGKVAARNVTITDELDPNLIFVSSNPPGNSGNTTWKMPLLMPDGPGSIVISALVGEDLANGTRLVNRFSIECDGISPIGSVIYTDVLNGSRLDVNKTAMRKEVRRGEEVAYAIKICNRGGEKATNVSVKDIFDSRVEIVYASPPMQNGIWNFGSIEHGECVQIALIVRVPRADVEFTSRQEINGSGFVSVFGDYTTALKPYVITNSVFVTSDEGPTLSDTEKVTVIGEAGTDLKVREHGSGSYENHEILRYLSSNKSLELEKLLEARYQPTSFGLQRNRTESFDSRWSESVRARNGITGASFMESYRNAISLDSEDRMHLDENGSKISLVSDFHSLAHFSMSKKDCKHAKGAEDTDIIESREDYAGSFNVSEKIQEHGRNVLSEESISGAGYASLDKRVWNRQRSYESGTGPFHLDETIQSSTGFLSKEIEVRHEAASCAIAPGTNLTSSLEWREGLWARGDDSFLGERFFSTERLEKEAVLRGLREIESQANFSGMSEFRIAYKGDMSESAEIDLMDELAGEYSLKRRVLLAGVSKYDQPHLSIYLTDLSDFKDSSFSDSSILRYTITVKNDGNSALGPIYLRDLFPPGTQYLGSSVGPSELTPEYANWTLLSLGIGGSSTVDLKLNVTGGAESLVNRVEAFGGHDGQWVTAVNFSAIQLNWLPCCQPDIFVSKEAVIEPGTENIVDYRITLQNPWNCTMAASVVDMLPGGMRLIGSSLQPSDYDTDSNRVTWKIIDLQPGQTKAIEYRARALQRGLLVNAARVEAYTVDGSVSATAEASAEVDVRGVKNKGESGDASGWRTPACFDLNYSAFCPGDDLGACYSCGAPDDSASPVFTCSGCVPPGDDSNANPVAEMKA